MHSINVERAQWLSNVLEIRKLTTADLARLLVEQRTQRNLDETEFPRDVQALESQLDWILSPENNVGIFTLDLCVELAAATGDKPKFYYRQKHVDEEGWPVTQKRLRLLQAAGLIPQ